MLKKVHTFPLESISDYACRHVPESEVLDKPGAVLSIEGDTCVVYLPMTIELNGLYFTDCGCTVHVLATNEQRHVGCIDPVVVEVVHQPSGYKGQLNLGQVYCTSSSGSYLVGTGVEHDFDIVAVAE